MVIVLGLIILIAWVFKVGIVIAFLPLFITIALVSYHFKHSSPPIWWAALTLLLGLTGTLVYYINLSQGAPPSVAFRPILLIGCYELMSIITFRAAKKAKKPARAPERAYSSEVWSEEEEPFDEYEDDAAPDEVNAKQLCERLRERLTVDRTFWDARKLHFHCTLMPAVDSLTLNYEIKNAADTAWPDNGGAIRIKANVYDVAGELLSVESDLVLDSSLRYDRYSSSIFFNNDLREAASVEVYAYYEGA